MQKKIICLAFGPLKMTQTFKNKYFLLLFIKTSRKQGAWECVEGLCLCVFNMHVWMFIFKKREIRENRFSHFCFVSFYHWLVVLKRKTCIRHLCTLFKALNVIKEQIMQKQENAPRILRVNRSLTKLFENVMHHLYAN